MGRCLNTLISLLVLGALEPVTACAQAPGIITTVAGNTWILSGDGGPAAAAPLGFMQGVATDAAGNVFASDETHNIVVKISPLGRLTVVAGKGTPAGSFGGDGGLATQAILNGPSGVAVDAAGNLYIADVNNKRVRKVTPAGIISTVAGNGKLSYLGDGGPATQASLDSPSGVAVDAAGNLYIADYCHCRIRKVTPTGIISTVAGNGKSSHSGDGGPATEASFGPPIGVAVDAAGNLYIADWGNWRVRKVTPAGIISTVAGGGNSYSGDGGPATQASLAGPRGVAVDAAGNLYIAEYYDRRIRKVTQNGIISTVAGGGASYPGDGGPATQAALYLPSDVAVDVAGNLFIADFYHGRVRKVTPAGIISTVAGNGQGAGGQNYYFGDGGPATQASLHQPRDVAVDAAGKLFIADMGNNRVRRVTPVGIIGTAAGGGSGLGDGGLATQQYLDDPRGVAVDAAASLYIAEAHRVRNVAPAGVISTVAGSANASYLGDGGPATQASLDPYGVAVDAAGNLYIADYWNSRVRKVTPGGIISTVAGGGYASYSGDGGPATQASLRYPCGVAVDAAGNLYIADTGNYRIRKVTPAGIISTVAGGGDQSYPGDGGPAAQAYVAGPEGVAVDAAGNLYIADTGNSRIRKVTPAGIISTVAGNGNASYSGDGGPATQASLDHPSGVAVDTVGNLYIADTVNDLVRKVSFGATPNLSISLTRAGNAGSISFVIYGSGFLSGTTVRLVRGGQADIVASAVEVVSSLEIHATFDLRGKQPGAWDVVVTNPDGKSLTLAAGFTIEQGGQPQLWVTISGPGRIRRGSSQTFIVRYGNSGTIDAGRVSIFVELPRRVRAEFNANASDAPFVYDAKDLAKEYEAETVVLEAVVGRLPVGMAGAITINVQPDASIRFFSLRAAPLESTLVFSALAALEAADASGRHETSGDSERVFQLWVIEGQAVLAGTNYVVAFGRHPVFGLYRGGKLYTQVGTGDQRHMEEAPDLISVVGGQAALLLEVGKRIAVSSGYMPVLEYKYQISPHGDYTGVLDPAQHDKLVEALDEAIVKKTQTGKDCWEGPGEIAAGQGVRFWPQNAGSTSCAVNGALDAFGLKAGNLMNGDLCNPPDKLKFRWAPGLVGLMDYQSFATLDVSVVTSIDPNDKYGSEGSGGQRYVAADGVLSYVVSFENLRTATAPAQEVVITDQLDTANVDTSTLRLGSVRFGSKEITPPAGASQEFTTDVDLRPAQNLLIRISARLDGGAVLTWRFTSINPATGLPPADPMAGFLPPNRIPPEGEGAVSFAVALKKGLSTGTPVRNRAVIVFDKNPPINTPEWLNTVDNTKPASRVEALPANQSTAAFTVRWSGSDSESGVRDYTLFVSENNGPYTVWLANTTATSATFGGEPGKSYAFYSAARDQAGNVEDLPSTADATTRVVNTVTVAASVNGASFGVLGSPLAPGSIVSIFGAGFDPSASLFTTAAFVSSNPPTLPTGLAGVSVKFGGTAAALFFVGVGSASGFAPGAFQINCQVPMEVAPAVLSLEVLYNNALIATGAANIAATGPGVFTMTQSGQGQAVVLNEDGTLNGDPARPVVPGTQPQPTARGKVIVIFGTGTGARFKDYTTGQPLTLGTGQAAACAAEPLYVTAEVPVVTIGTVPAQVWYSGMAPCFVGLWQLNVKVPEQAPTGVEVPLIVSLGGRVSNTTTIAVQ